MILSSAPEGFVCSCGSGSGSGSEWDPAERIPLRLDDGSVGRT